MKSLVATFLLATLALNTSCVRVSVFAPSSPDRIATLLEFPAAVTFTQHVASPEDLARAPRRKGIPLASFSYSDRAHTSDSITVTVYAAGSFLGAKRAKFDDWTREQRTNAHEGHPATGVFTATDGRSIYQFPLALGPGGSAYGALLPCRDSRYELVLVQNTDFHDDEDPTPYSHHVSPKKDLRSIIETIERIVFP